MNYVIYLLLSLLTIGKSLKTSYTFWEMNQSELDLDLELEWYYSIWNSLNNSKINKNNILFYHKD